MKRKKGADNDMLLEIIKRQELEIKQLQDTVKSKEDHITKLYDKLAGATNIYVNVAEIMKATTQQITNNVVNTENAK